MTTGKIIRMIEYSKIPWLWKLLTGYIVKLDID